MESTVSTTQCIIINSTTVNYSREDYILVVKAQHFVRRLKYIGFSYWSKELIDRLFSDITEVGSKKDQDHPPVAGLESKQQFFCL